MTATLARATSDDPAALFEAGTRALAAGQHATAIGHLRAAAERAPAVAAVWANLAAACLAAGRIGEAIEAGERALGCQPGWPVALNGLANAQARAGDSESAIARYREALFADPGFLPAALNLADLLQATGDLARAQASYEAVLARAPDAVAALAGRAEVLAARGQGAAAIAAYRQALAAAPADPRLLNGLAIALLDAGEADEALIHFKEAARAAPERAEIQANLAQALQGVGRHDEAVRAFRRAIAIRPDDAGVLPFYWQSLSERCDWNAAAEVERRLLAGLRALPDDAPSPVPPFVWHNSAAEPGLRLKAARAYVRHAVPATRAHFSHTRHDGRRLSIGYLSPDFRRHSVATSFLDLARRHGRDGFDWWGFDLGRGPGDEVTDAFRDAFDRFDNLGELDDETAARRIAEAGIDVLIDLAGHTRHARLGILARQPAPVQAHYLGYGTTLGAPFVRYLVSDPVHTTDALAAAIGEAPVYLPHSFMALSRSAIDPAVPSRADQGLPDDAFVFACFNAAYKLDADTFALWLDLLRELPRAVLWLKQPGDSAAANLRASAAAAGIDPARLVFAARQPHARHLARLRLADLALDTLRHAGGVTTTDALWAGLPVLALAGDSHAARTGASILAAAGLEDCIAPDLESYAALALALACDPDRLADLRRRVAAARQRAPLFDPARLARQLEWAYRAMWRQWHAGLPPGPIRVPVLD